MSIFNKKKKYYFSDDSIASDTIIAFVLGGISLVAEIAGVISSIRTKGNVSEFMGVLYMCAILLSLCGIAFGWFGMEAEEGGVKSKRWSISLNIFTLLVPLFVIGLYFFVG
ncbi:MAG: hypothetical protein J6P57_04235 [Lachnospiraceae bacterium]|nr:hypothetical protein [Lachnospiraceae bacterium]